MNDNIKIIIKDNGMYIFNDILVKYNSLVIIIIIDKKDIKKDNFML